MEHLDRIAEAYAGELGESFQSRSRARIDWICGFVQGSSVLDVGCSQGICELLLARRGFRVLGIDLARESIEYARELASREPEEVQARIRLECRDFLAGAPTEETFDTVLLTEILEHLAEPGELVERAAACLVPGGRMIVTVPFGINDFPDHKQTFYMADVLRLLSGCVLVQRVEFLGDWVGFLCEKTEAPEMPAFVPAELVLREEKAFFSLERPLRDRLTETTAKQRKSAEDYETAKGWVRDRDEKLESVRKALEAARGSLEKEREDHALFAGQMTERLEALQARKLVVEAEREAARRKLAEAEGELGRLNARLKEADERLESAAGIMTQEAAFLRTVRRQLQQLSAQLAAEKQKNREAWEKLQKVYGTWYGRIALRVYKALKAIKHFVFRDRKQG